MERRKLAASLLRPGVRCERCDKRQAVDLHEKRTRARTGGVRSSEWMERDNIALLCRPCHRWVTDNPAEAQEAGWILPSQR